MGMSKNAKKESSTGAPKVLLAVCCVPLLKCCVSWFRFSRPSNKNLYHRYDMGTATTPPLSPAIAAELRLLPTDIAAAVERYRRDVRQYGPYGSSYRLGNKSRPASAGPCSPLQPVRGDEGPQLNASPRACNDQGGESGGVADCSSPRVPKETPVRLPPPPKNGSALTRSKQAATHGQRDADQASPRRLKNASSNNHHADQGEEGDRRGGPTVAAAPLNDGDRVNVDVQCRIAAVEESMRQSHLERALLAQQFGKVQSLAQRLIRDGVDLPRAAKLSA